MADLDFSFIYSRRAKHTVDGRHIPIVLNKDSEFYKEFAIPPKNKNKNKKSHHRKLRDERSGKAYISNVITSSRYTIYTFFPRQVYAQFSKLANIYFFAIAVLQMIPGWSTTGTYTTIIPILIFMGISMAREGYDDYKRHRLDKEENRKTCKVLQKNIDSFHFDMTEHLSDSDDPFEYDRFDFEDSNDPNFDKKNLMTFNTFHQIIIFKLRKNFWYDLSVGDIVLLSHDDWVPADLLLLTTDNINNECYVETMALDGETNLKCKTSHPKINSLANDADKLANMQVEITVEDPNIDLYNFEGNLDLSPHIKRNQNPSNNTITIRNDDSNSSNKSNAQPTEIQYSEQGSRMETINSNIFSNTNSFQLEDSKNKIEENVAKKIVSVEENTNNLDLYSTNIELLNTPPTRESDTQTKYPLTSDNVMYRGSIVRNTSHALGIVIFTGEETKIRMNALKNPRTKAPKLQKNINIIVAFMVFVVAMVSFFSYLGHDIERRKYVDNDHAWYLWKEDAGAAATIMSFIIMYNTMIPLSLYVTMEIIKVFQGKFMEWDIDMYYAENDTPCESRSATILEELGQVSYIFSDKTGTLTNNKMLFKKFSIAGSSWEHVVVTKQDEVTKELSMRNYNSRANSGLFGSSKSTVAFGNPLQKTSSDLDVISVDDNTILNQLGITKQVTKDLKENGFVPTISVDDLPPARTSVEYKGNSNATYTGRPSMRALYGDGIRRSIGATAKKSLSTSRRSSRLSRNSSAKNIEIENESINNSSDEEINSIPDLKTSFELIHFIQSFPETIFAKKAKFFILSLALCHTCLPRRKHLKNKNGNFDPKEDIIEYQSSSPDELALVTAARDLGYVVYNKNAQVLTIKSFPNGFENDPVLEDYEILNVVEFNSHRKRMSVLVKVPNESNRILLICKGADNVILDRLTDNHIVQDKIDELEANTRDRKETKAEVILQHKKSLERMAFENDVVDPLRNSISMDAEASLSLQAAKKSLLKKSNYRVDPEQQIGTIDQFLETVQKADDEIDQIALQSRKSLQKMQRKKYGPRFSFDNIPQGATPRSSAINRVTSGDSGYNSDDELKKNTTGVKEFSRIPTNDYNPTEYEDEMFEYIGSDELITNEEYVIEKTLQAIDDFSTDGLRTLLYAYKWINIDEYNAWAEKYHHANISIEDRAEKIQEVGGEIEEELYLVGATAIEDKLQDGVPETVQKIRRAGIKIWMLTGDKRETAINIGYSCKMIYDYSTVVVLTLADENIISKMNALSLELASGNIAHCVLVIDGATLTMFEGNPTLMSVFIEVSTKTDSVICCRASPSQKALLVSNIRNTDRSLVTLAIGDGANDIAMIQSADIGVGLAGKEGLQASRSSDYSIGQFRFLLKLLFVHGRYNYIRTAKFILCTFFKEVTFYLTQVMYQRYTMFSGSSLYEPWSLSMYNTLFTSLPVLCIGILEKDLKPITLLSVPELYTIGRLSKGFNLLMFLEWCILAACHSAAIFFLSVVIWGQSSLSDNSTYPLGVINFTAIIFLVSFKTQFLEMRNRNWIAFVCVLLSAGGWLVWCVSLPILHPIDKIYDVKYGFLRHFGRDITFWCTCFVLTMLSLSVDIVFQTFKVMVWPSDSDVFAVLERRGDMRKKLEFGAYNEMKQGWEWDHDPSSFQKYKEKVTFRKSRESSPLASDDITSNSLDKSQINRKVEGGAENSKSDGAKSENINLKYDPSEYEMLPSGKLIKISELTEQTLSHPSNSLYGENHEQQGAGSKLTSKITKKLRFKLNYEEEDVDAIIEQRMNDLE
ncbi:hypothetical protein TBLA_0B09370 [Henningerozyma blattae CBS 6284]|uniref:Phospholipid-transporting ATPase n=1 Tax=Henningerozyma blattae (strain ATCC 34711 / CBS 6284 / DSM 70876 / NBRC 10599 / NRRL Y-10934 / UCD 77-7) TaxID=1071380 RepID=I2H052_HENB6|nr:hypothetical protein TBLA_0B09370 [Tetrapisispora blattae CBS 6284]CCH59754.1 hypothetical protein TBLA_0B09370 [Tetrapisispora blattae CBS 6284]